MAALGADPEALESVVVALRRATGQLDHIATGLSKALRRSGWEGPDANRFEREWQVRHRVALRLTSAACSTLARGVQAQADQQRRASARTEHRSATNSAPGPALPDLARSTQIFRGGLEAGIGPFGGALAGVLTVAHLPGGRRRVDYTEVADAGAMVSAGASIAASTGGEPTLGGGSSGNATARLQATTSRRWTVQEQHLPLLLAGLVAEASPLGLPFRAADQIGQGIDDALGLLGIETPLGDNTSSPLLPAPDATEHLAGVVLGAGSTVATGSAGASAAAAETVSAGITSGVDGKSMVVQMTGSGSTGVSARLLQVFGVGQQTPLTAEVSMRLEVPLPRDAAKGRSVVRATVTSTVGEDQSIVRAAVDLRTAGPAGDTILRAADQLAHGQVDRAAATLAGISLPNASVSVSSAWATVETSSLAVGLVGTGGSVIPSASVQDITVHSGRP